MSYNRNSAVTYGRDFRRRTGGRDSSRGVLVHCAEVFLQAVPVLTHR